jgi:hypothetical protein
MPRILGYILKPIKPFPLSGSYPISKTILIRESATNNDMKEEIYFSSTDNFLSLNDIKNYKRKYSMLSGDKNINITFINKQDCKDKYFNNFENLYQECINEWTKNLKI